MNLCFTLFNVSRETYLYKKSSGYEIKKEFSNICCFFLSITSIVLYQKLLSESRRDEFNFDIIYTTH